MNETRDLKDDLDIIENRAWQERFWSIQRVAWVVMALILIAAILGAFGSGGPLATARAETAGAVIDYPRIGRWQAAAEMIVGLPPRSSGPVEVHLSSEFLEVYGIDSISPAPRETAATPSGHRYTFDVVPGGERKSLVFHLRAMRAAMPTRSELRLGNSAPAQLNFVVLP
jgi:hypothetical protein